MTKPGIRHTLKAWPESFQAVWDGLKPFEIRRNDRNFEVGDSIQIMEWRPIEKEYTGRVIGANIIYIVQGEWELPSHLAVMTLSIFSRTTLSMEQIESDEISNLGVCKYGM